MRSFSTKINKLGITALASTLALGAAFSGTALAGRGGSRDAIQSAVNANSIDAIQAELERSEHLVCAGCVDVVSPLVDHPDSRIRQVAAWWLARRGTSRQVYVAMLTRLSQPDSVKARNAADVLGEFKTGAAIPALGAALSNPLFTGEARAAMARALGAIGRAEAAAPLVQSLADASPLVKAAALEALREVDGFHDGGVAVALVGDVDAQVRATAVTTLGVMHTTTAASALVQALANDPSEAVRKKAAWSLGEIGAPASAVGPALQLAAAKDTSPFVRSLAQASLGNLTR
ncbi:MAG: lyase domain protein repeat-containing protein [Myxococcales bacterium]|nr:lyase domain protein repeat-containing protein [Myxococcales bacterium]